VGKLDGEQSRGQGGAGAPTAAAARAGLPGAERRARPGRKRIWAHNGDLI